MWHIRIGVVLMAASALVAQDPPSRVGRLNYRDGAVSFQPTGINEWVDADINRPLTTGDSIWVGDRGRTEIHVGSTALRLSANSSLQFLNLDDRTVQIRLSEGTLKVRLRSLGQNQIVEVDTPNLAFNLERPGEYRLDANPDSQTTVVTVLDGEGEVTGGGQTFPIYARQRVVVRGGDPIDYNLGQSGQADEFDQWCASRDRREDQSLSARYVSREIPGYEDLDEYGRWENQPGYGQVWMPTRVEAGWAPYRDGHWAWIAPWGWTWVDDAPWGFAPYHYGRWSSFGGRWGWIPGAHGVTPFYAPALVAWIGGGRGGSGFSMSFSIGSAPAIGWFPLGPREPYFPSYNVSRGYFTRVNTTNTIINNTTINNYYGRRDSNHPDIRYVNQRVQNGVTAIPQNAFAGGRRVNQYARAVPAAQLASTQVVEAPAIAPQRASVLGPRADTAARAARPPANVVSRPVVARTAPPPVPVPFERQQAELAKNPGRPLPPAEVGQIRQGAPVRVVDMGRVRRVQPTGPEPARGQQSNAAPPAVTSRGNVPPGQQRQQPQESPHQQQQKQQDDALRQQEQRQRQEAVRKQDLKQQEDALRQQGQKEQQERQQQDALRQQEQRQRQDAQRMQQQQQQEAQRLQQEKQQQDALRQQEQRQRQDAQRMQQQQQQEAQRLQQEKQQQDASRQKEQRQRQDQQRIQQQQQQEAQRLQQEKQRQDAQRRQQQKQLEDSQRQQKPQPSTAEPQQQPDRRKKQKPPSEDDKKLNQ